MAGLFDDIVPQNDLFGDIFAKPSFTNVEGGSTASTSFAGVQGGSASTPEFSGFGVNPDENREQAISDSIAELPSAVNQGLQAGGNKLGEWATLAGAPVVGLFDDILGTNAQDKYFENVVSPFTKGAEYNQEQINKMHLPGQVVAGVAQGAPDLALAAMSGGETAVPRFAATALEVLGTMGKNIATMSGPLAAKAGAQALGEANAQGKAPWDATTDALKAIGETLAFTATGGQVEGNLASRVIQGATLAGGTEEAIRAATGGQFDPAALGGAVAMGAGFGAHGGRAPDRPVDNTRIDVSRDIPLNATGEPVRPSEPEAVGREPQALETPPRAPESVTEPIPDASVQELSPNDLSPAELAAFQRQQAPESMFDDLFQNNASGESSVSLEAIDRFRGEQENGQYRMIIDRDGTVTPIVTADGVDYSPKEGQIIVQANTDGQPWSIIQADPAIPRNMYEGRLNAAKKNLQQAYYDRQAANAEQIDMSSEAPKTSAPDFSNAEEITLSSEPAPTSTKNAVMELERSKEGRDPIIKEAAKTNESTVAEAQEAIKASPSLPKEIVARLNNEGVTNISARDEGVLLLEKTRLRNAREDAAKRASDTSATEEQRSVAKQEWNDLEGQINDIDQATHNSGKEWGRFGQFRQRQMNSDFSLAALEQKERVRLGRPLTEAESKGVKAIAEKIETAQAKADSTASKSDFDTLVRAWANEMRSSAPKTNRREWLTKLEKGANESRDWFKKNLSKTSAGVDPAAFFHLARIGAYHIAKGAVKLADWMGAMKKELGSRFKEFEPDLPKLYDAAKAQHEKAGFKLPTKEEVKASIGEKVTQRDVAELARAHINAGTHGEDAVMKAVHNDLKDRGLSERDVRRLFSDYGKAKFPSKEADKAELRELRQLVQMQESIDRIAEGNTPLKSGTQRDKPSQSVREKRRQLNDMLKGLEAKSGRDPEKLATYMQARLRILDNQIEDLNTYLKTGKKPERTTNAPEPTAELKAKQAERDALKKEVEEKFGDSEYQAKRNKSLKDRLAHIEERIKNNDYSPRTKEQKQLDKANKQAKFELDEAKIAFRKMQLKHELDNAPKILQFWDGVKNGVGLFKAVHTGFDVGAYGKQAGMYTLAHPIRATKTLVKSMRDALSEARTHHAHEELKSRENYRNGNYKKGGLSLTDRDSPLRRGEEEFSSRFLEKLLYKPDAPISNGMKRTINLILSGARFGERFHRTFLNRVRADGFDMMLGTLAKDPNKPTKVELERISDFMNDMTGRGKIVRGTENLEAAGLVLWATRLYASRANLITGRAFWSSLIHAEPRIARGIAIEYARALAGAATIYGIATMFKDRKDEKPLMQFDPRSTDFGKLNFGKHYIDVSAGTGAFATLAAQEATGKRITGWGQAVDVRKPSDRSRWKFDPTAWDLLTNFVRTRLNPPLSAAVSAKLGEDPTGQKTDVATEATHMASPITALQAIENAQKEGNPMAALVLTALDSMGYSASNRNPYPKKETK